MLRTVDSRFFGGGANIETYRIVQYLYDRNKYLAYELSPLVGSIFTIAASNLTRIHLLWYFMNKYDANRQINQNSVNSMDFRDYNCIDSFIDTLINVKSIIPTQETVYSFYKILF